MNFAVENLNVFFDRPPRRQGGRVVFGFGLVSDASAQSAKTKDHCRPIEGEPDVIKDIETEQSTIVRIAAFKDRRGRPATVDGLPRWATDDSDKLTIEPAADGMSCKVTTGLIAGTAKLQVAADADLGPNEKLLVGVVDFNIAALQATGVDLTVDDPTDATSAPP